MDYPRLGATGLRVSELCLGTMTFGRGFHGIGVVEQEQADAMVRQALDAGVNLFDTADVYSTGQSEQILGAALRAAGVRRESVVIATKVRGAMSDEARAGTGDVNNLRLSRKHLLEACDASLGRLGVDYLDLYQIHGYDAFTPLEETLEALDDLVRRGKVLYVGCSNLAARHLVKALYLAKSNGWARFVSLQAYYSLAGRDVEHELLPTCIEEGLGVLAWSPLSGGTLSGKYRHGSPEVARRNTFDFPPISARLDGVLEVLEAVAAERGISMATAALAWVRQQPGVTSVIIGARDADQLRENLASADLELTPEELVRLGAPTQPDRLYPQWMMDFQAGGVRPS